MSVIFISEINTPVGYHILKQYYINGHKIIGFSTEEDSAYSFKEFKTESVEFEKWNRTSTIGIKNLIYKGINKFKTIDEAVIIQSIPCDNKFLPDISSVEIEKSIDTYIKGNFFLLKELVKYMEVHPERKITLVNNIIRDEETTLSPLSEVCIESYRTLTKSLINYSKEHSLIINAFESKTNKYNELSEYFYKIISDKSSKIKGKTFYFPEKKGLFKYK